jgi:hypothetical protein
MSAGDVANIVTATAAVLAATATYVQYVIKRSTLPSVQFDLEFQMLASENLQSVGQVGLIITNVGSSMLVVTNVKFRAHYAITTDELTEYSRRPTEPRLPRRMPVEAHSWQYVVTDRTFVQAGVTQAYRQPILLPANMALIDILGAFDYRIQIGSITRLLIFLFARPPKDIDWRKGITNHTVRRNFSCDKPAEDSARTEQKLLSKPES